MILVASEAVAHISNGSDLKNDSSDGNDDDDSDDNDNDNDDDDGYLEQNIAAAKTASIVVSI